MSVLTKGVRAIVTGGAGFIGSHLVDRLVSLGLNVKVLDNLSTGSLENLKQSIDKIEFVRGDITNLDDIADAFKDIDVVFHLAANPEVRIGDPNIHFKQNVLGTCNVLEAVRFSSIKYLVFTSSSTVYGDATVIPTVESYGPLKPISLYGAAKLAAESLISAYSYTFKFKSVVYRLANVVGPRLKHGVIYDFIEKLKKNSNELEILGDGTQSKSYLWIGDCIDGMLTGLNDVKDFFEVYNLGSMDRVDVATIARIVVEEMGLGNVTFRCTGGVNGGRGWIGDVKYMLLDTSKLMAKGWKPKYSSVEAIRLTVRHFLYSRYL